MLCTFVKRCFVSALSLGLLSSAALAGGFDGCSPAGSYVTPREARVILAFADEHRDGNFRVSHNESAGAEARTGTHGETAWGFGNSVTEIFADTGVTSWKRSVQRGSGQAQNGSANASGFSASFVKVRTDDGKYYMFKGMINTGASANSGGTSTSQSSLAKSAGGRY